MSTIETILTRMMNEPPFAEAVFADAGKALSEYELSGETLESFKYMSREELDVFTSASPEARLSFAKNLCVGCDWGPPILNHNESILTVYR